MFSPLIPMHFPVFWAHLRKIAFLYSMHTWKELCDKLAISWLKVAKTWANWRLSWKPYARISAGMTKGKSEDWWNGSVWWRRRRNTCRCFVCMDRSMGCSSKTALIVRYLGMPWRARGNIKIGKNHPENTLIHPHTENDSRSPAYLCTWDRESRRRGCAKQGPCLTKSPPPNDSNS